MKIKEVINVLEEWAPLAYAEDLAEFHRVEDTLTVNTAIVQDIYNEFSSGKQDITAIKDFVRMFYERAGADSTQLPKYLLLFGDASYDFKFGITNVKFNFNKGFLLVNRID